jgi:hypothetical protein
MDKAPAQRPDIDIGRVLNDYLATTSTEQLTAELETPQRKALMTIPDEQFFHTTTAEGIVP